MGSNEDWFSRLEAARPLHPVAGGEELRHLFLSTLDKLEEELDREGPRKFSSIQGLNGFRWAVRLDPDERLRAEQLGERLWSEQGTGRTYAEEALLGQVAAQASPGSLPFFRAAVEASRQRDSFQVQRRRIATAAVALIARHSGDPAAHSQLSAWLEHPDVAVRTEAVDVYGRIHRQEDGTLTPAARAALERVANEDRVFAPRFLARGWLHTSGAPLPVKPQHGVYAFKASLGHASRTVELKASQTLPQLASAILNAFHWDHDHLYEFALTGDLHDHRFILPDEDHEPFRLSSPQAGADELSRLDMPLGALGLAKGHKFIFHYDFGDNHRFQVTVTAIHEQHDPGSRYPRVVAETGEAPEQYPSFDLYPYISSGSIKPPSLRLMHHRQGRGLCLHIRPGRPHGQRPHGQPQ